MRPNPAVKGPAGHGPLGSMFFWGYWLIAILSGTFKNISDEFYRRLAVPYEDRQIAKSGDVDLYAAYLAEIEKPG